MVLGRGTIFSRLLLNSISIHIHFYSCTVKTLFCDMSQECIIIFWYSLHSFLVIIHSNTNSSGIHKTSLFLSEGITYQLLITPDHTSVQDHRRAVIETWDKYIRLCARCLGERKDRYSYRVMIDVYRTHNILTNFKLHATPNRASSAVILHALEWRHYESIFLYQD